MLPELTIRIATAGDLEEITSLFRSTIETINAGDYNHSQVQVWSAGAGNTERWLQKIAEQYFLAAFCKEQLTGFASIDAAGYLDFMYIHKDYQRRGIATQLLLRLEQYAGNKKIPVIYSNVSITAKGFFEKHGYRVKQQQEVYMKEVMLVNYRMEKQL